MQNQIFKIYRQPYPPSVGALWSIKSDKLQRRQSVTVRCTSWPPQFLTACWALMSSFSRVVNMPVFTQTADVIWHLTKWHFSDWKIVFWRIFFTFFFYPCAVKDGLSLKRLHWEPAEINSDVSLHGPSTPDSWEMSIASQPCLFLTEADRCGLHHTCGSDSRLLWNHMNDHCKLMLMLSGQEGTPALISRI